MSDQKLMEAKARAIMAANVLVGRFGPGATAEIYIGAAIGVLEGAFGSDTAAEYLRTLADELERTDTDVPDPPVAGHA